MRKLSIIWVGALLAVAVIFGGAAGATASHLINSKDIKNHSIRVVDVNDRLANGFAEGRAAWRVAARHRNQVPRLQAQVNALHDLACTTIANDPAANLPTDWSNLQRRAFLARCH